MPRTLIRKTAVGSARGNESVQAESRYASHILVTRVHY